MDVFALQPYELSSSFQELKYMWWGFMAPLRGDVEERERLWNNLDRFIYRLSNGYRLCVLGNLNG